MPSPLTLAVQRSSSTAAAAAAASRKAAHTTRSRRRVAVRDDTQPEKKRVALGIMSGERGMVSAASATPDASTSQAVELPPRTSSSQQAGGAKASQTSAQTSRSDVPYAVRQRGTAGVTPVASGSTVVSSSRTIASQGLAPSSSRAMSTTSTAASPSIVASARPSAESSTSSSASSSLSGWLSRARSGVDYLATNSKPVRSRIANSARTAVKALQDEDDDLALSGGLQPMAASVRGISAGPGSGSTGGGARDALLNARGTPPLESPRSRGQQTWSEWLSGAPAGNGPPTSRERIELMPGWVVRRPRSDVKVDGVQPFDLVLHASGFAASLRSPENATRSQRMFMRIAKGFAALPKQVSASGAPLLDEDNKLSDEPEALDDPNEPTPAELEAAMRQGVPWKGAVEESIASDKEGSRGSTPERAASTPPTATQHRTATTATTVRRDTGASTAADPFIAELTPEKLSLYQTNLDARLQPFWSSVSQRRVQLSVYPVAVKHSPISGEDEAQAPSDHDEEPLLRSVFATTPQGLFAQRLTIPWERIVSHGPSLQMAFAQAAQQSNDEASRWALYVKAEVIADGSANGLGAATQKTAATAQQRGMATASSAGVGTSSDAGANAFFSPAAEPVSQGSAAPGGAGFEATGRTAIVSTTVTPIAEDGGIRILSDLDDTVKRSNILGGAREVFRNAFCKDVADCCVPGMPELYWRLVHEGVAGFHYASNSPFELLPVIREFFRTHAFPRGYSLNLKYYGGKNLFNGLFEPPAERKKPKVIEVMDAFPQSKFVLIGDSGEQDLELYVAIAKERPQQVLAIVIRDVTTTFMSRLQLASIPGVQGPSGGGGKTSSRSSSASRTPAASTTPLRREPATSSEIDMHALSEALAAGASSTPGVDGAHQAANAGLLGHTREAARKLVGVKPDVDVKALEDVAAGNAMYKDVSQLKQERDQEVPPADSMTTTSTPSEKPSPSPSRQSTLTAAAAARPPATTSTTAAAATTTGSTSFTGSSSSASSTAASASAAALAANLSPTQQKLLRRSLEWADRVKRAWAELPDGVRMMFFTEPGEVEEALVRCVREERERREREGKGESKADGEGGKTKAIAGTAAVIATGTTLSPTDAQHKAEQEAAQEIA